MLIGNRSSLHKLPLRYLGGSTTTSHAQLRSGFGQAGMRRNRFLQDGATVALKTYSYPQGTYAPSGSQIAGSAYILPQRAGAMASFNEAGVGLTPSALLVGGITTTGTASLTLDFSPAAGQLISSGEGSAAMTFTVADLLLTASLNGIGSASLTLATNTPILGAIASATGSSSMAFAGTLQPYALGLMVGTTAVASNVVNANIVSVNGYTVSGNGQPGTEWGP